MPLSTSTTIYTGGAQTFTVNFALGFIRRADVQVRVNGEVDGSGDPVYRAFTWIDDSQITVTDTLTIGDSVQLLRTVSKTELKVNFSANTDVTPANLDLSAKHGLMVYQELVDGRVDGAESPIDAADRADAAALAAEADEVAAAASAAAAAQSASEAEAATSFTLSDRTKLDGIETAATADQTGAEIKVLYEGESDTNAFTDAEKTKAASVEQRANHTGTQALSTISDAGTVASKDTGTSAGQIPILGTGGKLPAVDGSLLTNIHQVYQSGAQTITSAGLLTLAHGLTGVVKSSAFRITLLLECTTAEGGYAIGDFSPINVGATLSGAGAQGTSIIWDSTNIYVRFGSLAKVFQFLAHSDGTRLSLTNANWKFHLRAEL